MRVLVAFLEGFDHCLQVCRGNQATSASARIKPHDLRHFHVDKELAAIIGAAWDAYSNSRKSPVTRKAGSGFADLNYDLAIDWLKIKEAIQEAQQRHDDIGGKPRILVINGSPRNQHTCPGEMSKSWRLAKLPHR